MLPLEIEVRGPDKLKLQLVLFLVCTLAPDTSGMSLSVVENSLHAALRASRSQTTLLFRAHPELRAILHVRTKFHRLLRYILI